ncbi:alanyl (membrane) aminopeptidase-like b [Brienomyrus brachyistius]|uniref:alanyl (membrane) aminopeptidase-like b n=1 Tax=Brienomyrus brachyistius TaxID=42636 RepID=UPI0020B2B9D4|nr:alanyl (membrane) aminopeptidase-like b [Brienomyrus brachyistius]
MIKGLLFSKALAVGIGVVTTSAVCSMVAMVVIYQIEMSNDPPRRPPTPPATTPFPAGPPPNLRLPDTLIPQTYKVYLQPHFHVRVTNITNQTFAFTGNSTVIFKCVKNTNRIFVHSKGLNVTAYRVSDGRNAELRGKLNLTEGSSNFMEIDLDGVLKAGETYTLFTAFEGELQDNMVGFYKSKYTENEEDRFLATTQMQPTEARRVFPCFDEPAMKAIFNVTIIHREGTTALSNSNRKSRIEITIDEETWLITEFNPTPKMSTYLLVFTVSEFERIPAMGNNKIRTWARPEAISAGQADYAQKTAESILPAFEDFYGIRYPLSKLEQIAIPDFSAGGMENWGLISYRESALLYEDGVSSTPNMESIARVISHELAHQWFGNLVTMKWWNDLWLNEGFATYVSYIGINSVHPKWKISERFVLYETQPVLQVDSLATSHPLSPRAEDVQTPADITQQFDQITYSKGASILRMLSVNLKDALQQGIKTYLNAYQYSNTEAADFWRHLQQALEPTEIDVAQVMQTWTQQMGYPLITINTTTGEVSQQHFLLNQTSTHNFVWHVPVRMIKSGLSLAELDSAKQNLTDWLIEKGPVRKPEYRTVKDQWLLANVDYTGYYRVNYNLENWEKLLKQLEMNPQEIPVINRGQLIDDAFNLARAHHVNTTLALNTTKFLYNETELIPWEFGLRNLKYFVLMFDRSEVYGPMKAYMKKQISPLYTYFENYTYTSTVPEDHAEQYNQINAISVACANELSECQDMATGFFKDWMENPANNMIQSNLRSAIYCSAIAVGGEKEWNFAWEAYINATTASEKDKLRYGMSCSRNIWILNRYLTYTLDPSKIRKMDFVSTVNYIAANVAGQSLAWEFVQSHWTYIIQEYGGGITPLGNLIQGVTERFSSELELKQLKQFQKDHGPESFGSATQALEQAIERTGANMKWVKENKQTVLEWFQGESAEK